MTIRIGVGRGYVSAERNKRTEDPIGVIHVDSLFSPVRRCTLNVTDTRVGQRTDYDKLVLEVETDGSIAPTEVPRDESRGRMGFLLGRFERPASEFYAEASANNDLFASEPARLMSPITENLLRAVDYGAVRTRRDANWATLHAALSGLNGLDLRAPDGAFMYPLLLGERARAVRDVLIAERVYVPVLWPDVGEVPGGIARELSEGILPLPVDQRYGEAEMSYVADLVAKLLKGGQ